ncbi:MAG TPA: L-dopachrome tautomerase-related protein, partial [Flavisolibacter sp.]|nr:L-dopachrome tautomerase-related protein [Flavisolibacter sp.]
FEGVAGEKSYINDVRIDTERKFAYLTNSNEGGILVLDLTTGRARQLLMDHDSVHSDPEYTFIMEGRELMKDGKPAKMQSDGIALTLDGEWLYYKPLTDNKLYRIRTEFLRDDSIDTVQVGEWVEDLGTFNTTDGMIFGARGILYQGDLQASSIVAIDREHKKTTLLQDNRLIWPDSYAFSEEGYLYISCSQIHKQPEYNEGVNKRNTAYAIYRIKTEG